MTYGADAKIRALIWVLDRPALVRLLQAAEQSPDFIKAASVDTLRDAARDVYGNGRLPAEEVIKEWEDLIRRVCET